MSTEALHDLLERLRQASGPDPSLDLEIANTVNWFEISNVVDISGRRQVPQFTRYLDFALKLARAVEPRHVGAFQWDRGSTKAVIDDQQHSGGANPAIALCIAALELKLMMDRNRSRS